MYLCLWLSSFFISGLVQAGVVTVATHTEKFVNSDCATTDSCDLKGASLRLDSYQVNFRIHDVDRHAFGTRMYFNYQTDSVANLENYGVVQMIRGCQYSSKLENGKVIRSLDYGTEREDTNVRSYPEWAIDGYVKDPIEWGSELSSGSRHNYYWNHFPGSAEPVKSDYFHFVKPSTPELWLRDLPGAAQYFTEGEYAHNFSFEFKACIYKTRDVPRNVPYAEVDFATPVRCFNWTSSFVYNHALNKFESPVGIEPFCLDKSNQATTRDASK